MSKGIVFGIRIGTNFTNFTCRWPEGLNERHFLGALSLVNDDIQREDTPSIVVFDSEKLVQSFGYAALKRIDEHHKDDMIFPEFVKNLFCNVDKVPESLTAENGVALSSVDFMEKVISYLLKQTQSHIEESCRLFVFTVPTVATNNAIQFLKRSTVYAGLSENQVLIIPEAVSVFQYCRQHHNIYKSISGKDVEAFSPGKRSVVLECEDDNVTISIMELKDDNSIKLVYSTYKDIHGSSQAQKEFMDMITEVFGKSVFDDFYSQSGSEYSDLVSDFCRNMSKDLHDKEAVVIPVPPSLSELFRDKTGKSIEQAIEQTDFAHKITYIAGKLKIAPEIYQGLFLEAATNIVCFLREVFQAKSGLENIVNIILAGYFSTSVILQDHLKRSFPKHHVIIPKDGNLVVAKGAVLCGQKPAKYKKVSESIRWCTAQVEVTPRANPTPPRKKRTPKNCSIS